MPQGLFFNTYVPNASRADYELRRGTELPSRVDLSAYATCWPSGWVPVTQAQEGTGSFVSATNDRNW